MAALPNRNPAFGTRCHALWQKFPVQFRQFFRGDIYLFGPSPLYGASSAPRGHLLICCTKARQSAFKAVQLSNEISLTAQAGYGTVTPNRRRLWKCGDSDVGTKRLQQKTNSGQCFGRFPFATTEKPLRRNNYRLVCDRTWARQ
jgi:hypothetical protein